MSRSINCLSFVFFPVSTIPLTPYYLASSSCTFWVYKLFCVPFRCHIPSQHFSLHPFPYNLCTNRVIVYLLGNTFKNISLFSCTKKGIPTLKNRIRHPLRNPLSYRVLFRVPLSFLCTKRVRRILNYVYQTGTLHKAIIYKI